MRPAAGILVISGIVVSIRPTRIAGRRQGGYSAAMTEYELDAIGLLCPLPVLKARKRLKDLKPCETLKLIATDPASVIDVPHFCNEQGHELLSHEASEGRHIFRIRHK